MTKCIEVEREVGGESREGRVIFLFLVCFLHLFLHFLHVFFVFVFLGLRCFRLGFCLGRLSVLDFLVCAVGELGCQSWWFLVVLWA